MFFLVERNAVFAEQVQTTVAANVLQTGSDRFGIHGIRGLTFKPQQHSLVAAMPFAGSA
ncbi:hypothetical protein ACVWVZ_005389 [Pseudomonas tolaasii]